MSDKILCNKTDWEQFTYDVIGKNGGGKILFQPRILCWYSDKMYAGKSLGAEYDGLPLSGIYKKLDISNRIYDYGECVQRVIYDKNITSFIIQLSSNERQFQIDTPIGSITMRLVKNTSNGGEFFSKWWVENDDDLKVYTYYEEASDWKFYPEIYKRIKNEWGTVGAPTLFMPRTTLMHAYLDTMGVETTTYALVDSPELVETYFKALNSSHGRYINVLNESPFRYINYGDNVHCGLVPPNLFEKYILPEYVCRTAQLHKAGKFVTAHWDGDTKTLLKYAKETTLDGIEAITPKPQGDVTIEEIKDGLGSDVYLVDGLAALLFAEPYSEQLLIDETKKLIKLFAPKLILGISDELASFGDINRVILVKKIVDEYNQGVIKAHPHSI